MEQPESSVLNSLDGKLYDHEMEQTRIYNECFSQRVEGERTNLLLYCKYLQEAPLHNLIVMKFFDISDHIKLEHEKEFCMIIAMWLFPLFLAQF